MYPHLDTALALSRSEQASLASINKELILRNSTLRSRIAEQDQQLSNRDRELVSNSRKSSATIENLQQSVMMLDGRLIKYQSRLASQDEALATLESRIQISEREKIQAQTDRQYLTQQLDQTKRSHHEDLLAMTSKHQLDMQRLQDDLTKELSRVREQWLQDQRIHSQTEAEKQALHHRVKSLEQDREADRRSLIDALASLETKRQEYNDAQRELGQNRAKVEALTIANTQQTSQISTLNNKVQNLNKQVMATSEELKTWKADAEQYHKQKLELDNDCSQLRDIISQLKDDLSAQREALHVAQMSRQNTLAQLEQEQSDRMRADKRCQNLEGDLDDATTKISELQRALADCHRSLRAAGDREEGLSQQISDMQSQHANTINVIEQAKQSEIEALSVRARASEQSLYDLRFKLRNAQAELNVAIDNNEDVIGISKVHLRSPAAVTPRKYRYDSNISSRSTFASPGPAPRTPSNNYSSNHYGGKNPTQVTATIGENTQPVRIAITPMKHRFDE